jgi:hypothetical protein
MAMTMTIVARPGSKLAARASREDGEEEDVALDFSAFDYWWR